MIDPYIRRKVPLRRSEMGLIPATNRCQRESASYRLVISLMLSTEATTESFGPSKAASVTDKT